MLHQHIGKPAKSYHAATHTHVVWAPSLFVDGLSVCSACSDGTA